MIEPAEYNLPDMITGCTYDNEFNIKNGDVVKDLTGCQVKMELYVNGSLYATLTTSDYLTVSPLDGRVIMVIPPSVTATYVVGKVNYRLEITETDGRVYRYLKGLWKVID